MVERHTKEGMVLQEELQTLAPDPLIWHGNGECWTVRDGACVEFSATAFTRIACLV
jgi:hypothetical protein